MKIETYIKEPFSVIGKEGSTDDGQSFIKTLWADANGHFMEVEKAAKRDENGVLVGIWGLMTDCSRSFQPWEDNFSRGLYLAGVECSDDAEAPLGWTKWTVPGYEYLCAECTEGDTFPVILDYMKQNGIPLVGAVHDFTFPANGKQYLYFPIRKL
jgi:predicted transcriptional regulator YdeE